MIESNDLKIILLTPPTLLVKIR